MSARKYLKGGLLLSGGSVLSAGCSFARNIIIARLISVEDFGIACVSSGLSRIAISLSNNAKVGFGSCSQVIDPCKTGIFEISEPVKYLRDSRAAESISNADRLRSLMGKAIEPTDATAHWLRTAITLECPKRHCERHG